MAKSRLQKEYEKELRLLERRIKDLQKKTEITFTPEEIEAVTKRKSRPRRVDIERVHALRGEELQVQITKARKIEPTRGKQLPQVEVHTGRTSIPEIKTHKERELLPEEVKKERRNYRARVRRLEKQGYDTSNLKPAREYTLEELRQLKGKKLSEQAYKGGQTAYESRKQIKEQHRQFNKIQRIADKGSPRSSEISPLKPRELGDYVDIGKGALTDKFTQVSMIQTIGNKLEDLNSFIYGDGWRENFWGEYSDTLLGLWYDILTEIGYPSDEEAVLEYERYLSDHETEIMYNINPIYDPSGYGMKMEDVKNCFTELMSILNRGLITPSQSQTLGDINERLNGA